jgi:hypothetical protein
MKKFVFTLALFTLTGCMTFSSNKLSELQPIKPSTIVSIEQSVSKDFSFEQDGGQMVTDNKMGRIINDGVLNSWKNNNYISNHYYVEREKFTKRTDYTLTLSGSQRGDSNIGMQVISGLTLFLIPNNVHTTFDVEYTLKNNKNGKTYTSRASEEMDSWFWLLYFPIAPFSGLGLSNTMDHIAEHVYQDFVSQGAFQP